MKKKKRQHLLTGLLSMGLSVTMIASCVVYASDTMIVPAEVLELEEEAKDTAVIEAGDEETVEIAGDGKPASQSEVKDEKQEEPEEEAETGPIESFGEEPLPTPTEEVKPEQAAAIIPEQADIEEAGSKIQVQEENTGLGFETRSSPFTIMNADQLIDFATKINNGTYPSNSNVVLAADIDMAGRSWTPIGLEQQDRRYRGTFDGNNHTILNVNYSTPEIYAGIFGVIEDATIKNLGVTGNISGYEYVGGIVGHALSGNIEHCWNGANIKGSGGNIGGIAGAAGHWSTGARIKNCYNFGSVNGAYAVGGIVGTLWQNGAAVNCFSYESAARSVAGDIPFGGPGVTNSYYLSTNSGNTAHGTAATEAQFKLGEVAWLLNEKQSGGIWKQTIGTDNYPTFTGNAVTQPQAPKPEISYSSSPNSITIHNSFDENTYGSVLYRIDSSGWTNSGTFENLKASYSYVISVIYTGSGNYTQSQVSRLLIGTKQATYKITIPQQVGVGAVPETIKISSMDSFVLGYEGQVNVKIADGITAGKVSLIRQNDIQEKTIASELLVDGQEFDNPLPIVATFREWDDKAVSIAFAKPEGAVAAGTYSGTVVFKIDYTQ